MRKGDQGMEIFNLAIIIVILLPAVLLAALAFGMRRSTNQAQSQGPAASEFGQADSHGGTYISDSPQTVGENAAAPSASETQ